jgi:hypothetical protein
VWNLGLRFESQTRRNEKRNYLIEPVDDGLVKLALALLFLADRNQKQIKLSERGVLKLIDILR